MRHISEVLAEYAEVLHVAQTSQEKPHGPEHTPQERQLAADACVALCGGDRDRARSLWKVVVSDCEGYLPHAAACALIRASNTTNLGPDVTAPEPS